MDFLEDFYDGLEKQQKSSSAGGGDASDPQLKKTHPCLHAFLTVTVVKKQPRDPGTMFLFCQHGMFKACVTDKKSQMTMWQAQDTLQGLLDALEADLSGGDRSLWRKKAGFKAKFR